MSARPSALLVALVAGLWFSLTATTGLDLRDEGRILLRSQWVAEGALPNRDFSDVYGPGVTGLNGLLLERFDHRIVAVRWSLVTIKACAAAAVWTIGLRVAPPGVAVAATVFAIATFGRASWNLNAPYAALYVLALGLAALAALLRAQARGRTPLVGVAGLAVGAALLFKHSLAAMYGVSLALGILVSILLEPARALRRGTRLALSAAFVGLLLLPLLAHQLPFRFVGPREYLLFFAPMHVLGFLVVLAPPGAIPEVRRLGPSTLVTAGAGVLAVPLVVASLYAHRGALGVAIADLVRWPSMLVRYAAPVGLPSAGALAALVAVLLLATAGALVLRRRSAAAAACAALALASGGWSLGVPEGLGDLRMAADRWAHVAPSLLAYGLLVVCAPALRVAERPAWLVPAVIVAGFHHATMFQVFPRAGYNVLLALPALAPSIAVVGAAAWRAHGDAASTGLRRRAAAVLLSLPVAVLALPAILSVIALSRTARVPIPFPEARGLWVKEEARDDIVALRAVVDYLDRAPNSPVFLMSNDAMILFLSRRRPMFMENELVLQLMGDNMLDPVAARERNLGALAGTLESAREPLIVTRNDGATRNVRRYLPLFGGYLDRRFTPAFTAGPYSVLRRRPGAAIIPRSPAPAARAP